jgi:hypothetical protein
MKKKKYLARHLGLLAFGSRLLENTMILAYCITPQPARGGPTAKRFQVHTGGAIVSIYGRKEV